MLDSIRATQPLLDVGRPQPVPLPFNKAEIEAFRYRYEVVTDSCFTSFAVYVDFICVYCSIEDVQRKVTSVLVRDARLSELKHEVRARV